LISGPVSSLALRVVSTDRTPSGRPASVKIWASASIDSGVCLAGLTIIVQPAATAGPILRVPMASGKFQGVMNRHGPTG
jgi:phosphoribosylcarboxyaminoimidazole (NCAIR) mutase